MADPVLTPAQVSQYYSSQSGAATPLSPTDWLARQSATPGSSLPSTKPTTTSTTPSTPTNTPTPSASAPTPPPVNPPAPTGGRLPGSLVENQGKPEVFEITKLPLNTLLPYSCPRSAP